MRPGEHLFVSPGLYQLGYGADQVLSQSDQSTSQTFARSGGVHLPAGPFFLQARLTVPFGLAPPPVPFWLLCLPSPGSTLRLIREGMAFSPSNFLASFSQAQCKNLPLLPSWLMGGDFLALWPLYSNRISGSYLNLDPKLLQAICQVLLDDVEIGGKNFAVNADALCRVMGVRKLTSL